MNSDKNKQNRQYYLDNRDKILEKKRKKFNCECGGRYTYNHKAKHLNSKKHQNYINKNNKLLTEEEIIIKLSQIIIKSMKEDNNNEEEDY